MNVSRLHAKIVYNFQSQCFELVVVGKNGVLLNGAHVTPSFDPSQPPQGVPLRSQVRASFIPYLAHEFACLQAHATTNVYGLIMESYGTGVQMT